MCIIYYFSVVCECSTFVDKDGYGRCRKMDHNFGGHTGGYSCYLEENSKCKDAIAGQQGKRKSSIACQGKNPFILVVCNFVAIIPNQFSFTFTCILMPHDN